jgi:hypothetical protein
MLVEALEWTFVPNLHRQGTFGDTSKEVDDVWYVTAAGLKEPGRVFTPIVADASCSTHHTTTPLGSRKERSAGT